MKDSIEEGITNQLLEMIQKGIKHEEEELKRDQIILALEKKIKEIKLKPTDE